MFDSTQVGRLSGRAEFIKPPLTVGSHLRLDSLPSFCGAARMTAVASKLYRIACRLAICAAIIAVTRCLAVADRVLTCFPFFVCHRSFLQRKSSVPRALHSIKFLAVPPVARDAGRMNRRIDSWLDYGFDQLDALARGFAVARDPLYAVQNVEAVQHPSEYRVLVIEVRSRA